MRQVSIPWILNRVNGEIDDLVTIVKGTVEDIDRMVSKEELEESISGINQRLRWVDTLISKLKKKRGSCRFIFDGRYRKC